MDTSPKTALKTELQVLRLNEASKVDLMETLRHIHGQTFQLGQKSSYKEMGTRFKKGYWEERGNLVVQSVCDYSNVKRTGCESIDRFKMLSISKLESYGFSKAHCIEAYDHCKGGTDEALELLHRQYFPFMDSDDSCKRAPEVSENEVIDMRADEMTALQSIYDNDVFEEKEPNRVWLLKFKIDHLLVYSDSEQKKKALHALEKQKRTKYGVGTVKEVAKCRNFVATGKCKYGTRCRYSHDIESERNGGPIDLDINWFYLEIRFPNGNRYPHESPIISLKTTCPDISRALCLRITRRCLLEARALAVDGMPSVYTIGDLLQNEEEITTFLKNDRYAFPDPKRSIFYAPECNENLKVEKKKLPTHYTKGSTGRSSRSALNGDQMLKDDLVFSRKFAARKTQLSFKQMMKTRQSLPAWLKSNDILDAVKRSQVVVISGETGCGKSTQVPQFILDDYLSKLVELQSANGQLEERMKHVHIVCTQPRRLSAIGVAERVADERCEKIGNMVGYQIRLENKISAATRLTFCTTGILLRRLQSEPMLDSVTHIIVDEVHERSEESDFLLLILKELLAKRSDLRVILMSATLNASLFSNYFGHAPVLEIPGRTFPVEQLFMEDIMERSGFVLEPDSHYCRRLNKNEQQQLCDELEYSDVKAANAAPPKSIRDENLSLSDIYGRYNDFSRAVCKSLFLMDPFKINAEMIEAILRYIVDVGDSGWPAEGSILIFLPGLAEIQMLHDTLNDSSVFSPRTGKYLLVPLHSSLTNEEQAMVFRRAPVGKRKIVLSTNIAETSVTIDDCVFVIDCGQMKEKRFDANRNMESLDLVWESRANALQRKGRAGRVMPGICIHLFTSHRYHHHFLGQPVPEIQRVPLEQLLLRIKTLPNFADYGIVQVIGKSTAH